MRKPPRSGHKGGAHLCATCNHPEREAIEAALAARTPSLFVLEAKYGIDHSSLSRHRSNHMSKSVVIHPALPANATTLQQLEDQARRVEAFFTAAERAGHADQLLAGSRELRILRAAISKVRGEANGAPVAFSIQTSEEWKAIREIVWDVLEPHRKLRNEIGRRLMALAAETK